MKKADFILIGVVLVLALAALGWMQLSRENGAEAVVYVDGEEQNRYPLDRDCEVTIEGVSGGYNLLVISGGTASVTEADCPDALCVKEGSIQYDGQTIVCLPHRVVVEIEGGEDTGVDAIAQ